MKINSPVIFFLVALSQFMTMAFLIIGCVTAPVFKQIGYSKYDSITYGTFGYCKDGSCSKASYNYSPDQLSDSDSSWKFNSHARSILGKIIFITPIAAGLNFLALLSTIISILLMNILSSERVGGASAIMFFVNLALSTLGFLSAALICIVVFLLFFPHVTWCSWILIPGAAMSLLVVPLIFLAYSRSSCSRVDDELEELEEKGILLNDPYPNSATERFNIDAEGEYNPHGDSRTNLLNSSFNNRTNATVLPNIIPRNQDSKLSNVTTSTTSDISTFDKEAKEMGNSNTSELNEEEEDGMAFDKRKSASTYSVIESESGLKSGDLPNNYMRNNGNNYSNNNMNDKASLMKREISGSPSLASSDYSQRDAIPHRNPSRLLNDIMETSYNEPNDNSINHAPQFNDKDNLTSISQRGVNLEAYNQMPQTIAPQNMRPYAGQPHPVPLAYPQQQQQQQQQHQYNLYQRNIPTGPDPSNVLLQSNPYFNIGPSQPLQHRNPAPRSGFAPNPMPNQGPIAQGYQPAYKRRMQNKNMPRATTSLNNPYGFR